MFLRFAKSPWLKWAMNMNVLLTLGWCSWMDWATLQKRKSTNGASYWCVAYTGPGVHGCVTDTNVLHTHEVYRTGKFILFMSDHHSSPTPCLTPFHLVPFVIMSWDLATLGLLQRSVLNQMTHLFSRDIGMGRIFFFFFFSLWFDALNSKITDSMDFFPPMC